MFFLSECYYSMSDPLCLSAGNLLHPSRSRREDLLWHLGVASVYCILVDGLRVHSKNLLTSTSYGLVNDFTQIF